MTAEIQPLGISRFITPVRTTGPEQNAGTASAVNTPATTSRVLDAQSRSNIKEAVEKINQQMQSNNRNLSFAIDDAADQVVITVKNSNTGEVIRQIPDESLLRVAHNIEDIKGLLHNATS